MIDTCILRIFLYGSECWAITKRDEFMIDSLDNSIPLGELEETTRTPSYHVDEDYPARCENQQPP